MLENESNRPTDAKYTTVEGHPIVRDGEYETRDGKKATILGFVEQLQYSIVGIIFVDDVDDTTTWNSQGQYLGSSANLQDLMRPWPDKKSEDAEGWIKWGKSYAPNYPKDVTIELEWRDCLDRSNWRGLLTDLYDWSQVKAYRLVKEPEEKKPEKQTVYKLSEMWIVWEDEGDNRISQSAFTVLQSAQTYAKHVDALALTRADATEFYEGEGLETGDK